MNTGFSAHLRSNLWLWIAIFAVVTAGTGLMRYSVGGASHWGDSLALAGAILGGLVMMKSEEGTVYAEDDVA
jgi:hypothetical protein